MSKFTTEQFTSEILPTIASFAAASTLIIASHSVPPPTIAKMVGVRNFRINRFEVGDSTREYAYDLGAMLTFYDERMIYQLPAGTCLYLYVVEFANIKKFQIKNTIALIEFKSAAANRLIFKNSSSVGDLTKLRLNDSRNQKVLSSTMAEMFVFMNSTLINAFPELVDVVQVQHMIEVWPNQATRLATFANGPLAPNVTVKRTSSDLDDESDDEPPFKKRKPVLRPVNDQRSTASVRQPQQAGQAELDGQSAQHEEVVRVRHTGEQLGHRLPGAENIDQTKILAEPHPTLCCFSPDKILSEKGLKKPCCGMQLVVNDRDELKQKVKCLDEKCRTELAYSFCENRLVYTRFTRHCPHDTKCILFPPPCKQCKAVTNIRS